MRSSYSIPDILDQESQKERLKQLAEKMLSEKRNYCTKCKSNNCIKHLERFRMVKLSLPPFKSSYDQNYQVRKNIVADRVDMPIETRKFSTIIGDSAYQNEFKRSSSNDYQLYGKRRDSLRLLGGPLMSDTTYQKAYPVSEESPKKEIPIKNPECLGLDPNMKISASSSYRDCFKGGIITKVSPIKRQGNLKLSGSFIGESSYKNQFAHQVPINNQSFAPKLTYQPVNGIKIGSSYKSQFLSYPSEVYSTIE